MLAHGLFEDHHYQLFSALPNGPKRQPPPDPELIASVVDELQEKLDSIPRRAHSAAHHVMGHGDFSHRNLRLAADGQLWLFDWEYAGWSPRLADETRYWATWFGARVWPRVGRDSTRMLDMLRRRGTDEEILEAVCWPEHNLPIEQALRNAIQAKIAAS
jgi:aminoglycoside phosphotransferase (APT) family kinase protein